MRVGLLGPLSIRGEGEIELNISAPKERAVVSLLSLRAGAIVRPTELYAALWGDEAPPSAVKTVQTYISGLRKVLPSGVIQTKGGGYQLRLGPDDVDVTRFERLHRSAAEAEGQGELRAALDRLDEAFSLWRGDPLPDLADQPLGMAEAARLSELHRAAEERSFEIRLALGQQDSLIADLEAAVGRDPMRERRWQQLMLALYRAGRQADALRAFQRLRTVLADELGLDPGEEVRSLEAAILRHDPGLAAAKPGDTEDALPKPALPSGNVTFVVSEVADGDRASATVEESPLRSVRAVMAAHGGVDISLDADTSLVVFADTAAAVAACLEVQRQLAADETPSGKPGVRMGVHMGLGRPSSDGAYASAAIYEAARICAAAHGGQVLLSSAIARILRHDLPEGSSLVDRGSFRLSGFEEPERIFQLVHPTLESSFPPLLASIAQSHNLPDIRTSFVGRVTDIEAVEELLADHPLVSVVGPGGAGKTRLAVEVGARLAGVFEGGVRLCDLSPVSDGAMVASSLRATFGLPDTAPSGGLEPVISVLRDHRALLVLDNCEHVAEAAAEVARDLLSALPDLHVLTTTRQPLGVRGERVWRLEPLPVPGPESAVDSVMKSEAVVLFENRARLTRPDFSVGERNAAAVAAICRQLEGLPLAIELAAAQVTALDPRTIADRLKSRVQDLRSRAAEPDERHRTLETAVDWSYRLLDDHGRRLLRFLSVFANGFTIDAVQAVSDASDPVELIAELVNSSLVVWDSDADRYRLLEPIRAFARSRLEAASEADVAAARHLSWCARLADSLTSGSGAPERYELFNRELDNFRAALTWAATHASPDASRLAEAVRDPIQSADGPGDESRAVWEVSVAADRTYFDRMEAEGVEFPGSAPDRTFELNGEVVSIGRASAARGIRPEIDLSAPPIDAGISHEHALLVRHGLNAWAVVDTGSTNGIFLNDATETLPLNRITPLADGDQLHLGAWTTITVRRVPSSHPS